jgi:hypothetical protein
MAGGRIARLCLLAGIALGLNLAGHALVQLFDFQIFPRHEPILHLVVLSAAGLYILLMTIPFMPGIEIGLALLFILGGEGALLVYLCTVTALSLAFWLGRVVPDNSMSRLLLWLHFQHAAQVVGRLEALPPQARLESLYNLAPKGIVPFLIRHRAIAIAVLLNVPGNALIGGGGGIAMLVGISRLLPFHQYLVVAAVAVAPVPLFFYLTGVLAR